MSIPGFWAKEVDTIFLFCLLVDEAVPFLREKKKASTKREVDLRCQDFGA